MYKRQAVDSVIIVVDGAKGVETQTRKLMEVCRMRKTPVIIFVNKMDREGKDPFDLLDELEEELMIQVRPLSWPIEQGARFKGVYNIYEQKLDLYQPSKQMVTEKVEVDIHTEELDQQIGKPLADKLRGDLELIEGVYPELDVESYLAGDCAPVFFGSALTNFGIETFLHHFLKMTSAPLPRESDQGVIDPVTGPFSGFIFKIQANMNKAHRDRIAFMRICSGKFEAGMEVYHVQGKRKQKLLQPQQVMAQSRSVIDEAYAGDVIGIFDPGTFSIGDTICAPGKKFQYAGIPTFAPEHFCRVVQTDTMKRKQFVAGITQIAQEGAIQIFKDYNLDLSEIIVGVVGVLQFDVLKYRMENEYNCEVRLDPLPYSQMRWVKDNGFNLDNLRRSSEIKKAKDMRDNPLLLFQNEWNVRMCLENNEGLELEEVK